MSDMRSIHAVGDPLKINCKLSLVFIDAKVVNEVVVLGAQKVAYYESTYNVLLSALRELEMCITCPCGKDESDMMMNAAKTLLSFDIEKQASSMGHFKRFLGE